MRLGFSGWAWIAAAALGGCQVYDPSLVGRDAGMDAGPPFDAGPGGPCEGHRPPPRPTSADGADVPEAWYGLRLVVLRQSGDLWRDIGYNLDGLCTYRPTYATECQPTLPRPETDGTDGIDNVFGGSLFPLVDATVMGLEESARAAQEAGSLPVLRIRNWNGTPDDPRIEITITQAIDMVPGTGQPSPPAGVTFSDYQAQIGGTPAAEPVWDGEDFGWMRVDTFLGGNLDQPRVYDDNAYVAGGVIVASLPTNVEILFPAETTGVVVRIAGGIATARIGADGITLEDVVVAGRWRVVDLLSTAENVGVCMGSGEYDLLEARLYQIADVRGEPGTGGMGVPCDAISLGVGFTGTKLRVAGTTLGRPVANVCLTTMDGGVPDAGP